MAYIAQLILAHGAGQGMESDFMQQCKTLFEVAGVKCTLFDFDYMSEMKRLGRRRPPERLPKLIEQFNAQFVEPGELPLFIGGKSMGGRVASHVLQASPALGGICFGYPFHPPGKSEKIRTEHLSSISKPLLVLQGERDPFGKPEEIESYRLPDSLMVTFIPAGEHSFITTRSSGVSWQENMQFAVAQACQFIKNILARS
ncbi:alpha/beta family hydrolase [Planctobacterium marinum]|uniref:alpha/beta family hydrolase n=1 Tax=Planctobacterium marinum TaxID=1631968 RepID=UPI001E485A8B|nr:alpha/beta family hydrolase [Planctobacterium marinum]MCC2603903.1 alpha/beta hydrolase [Planctobacterium marinum]